MWCSPYWRLKHFKTDTDITLAMDPAAKEIEEKPLLIKWLGTKSFVIMEDYPKDKKVIVDPPELMDGASGFRMDKIDEK